jgi:hypothetical protein
LASPGVFERIGINEEKPIFLNLRFVVILYSDCELNMDAPPDGGYGWVVVGAIFWNNAHHWGLVSVSCPKN